MSTESLELRNTRMPGSLRKFESVQMSYALCYKTGRSALQPLFILRHLEHAAQIYKPHGSSRLL
eukprot:1141358-Pelagomonas_calceolata.AAC.16